MVANSLIWTVENLSFILCKVSQQKSKKTLVNWDLVTVNPRQSLELGRFILFLGGEYSKCYWFFFNYISLCNL